MVIVYSKTNGEVLSVITNDVDTLSQNFNQSATQLVSSIATLIGILIMMRELFIIIIIMVL